MEIDLNAPAFGKGAQRVDAVGKADAEPIVPADDEVQKPDAVKVEADKDGEPDGEPSKVPYSRFKKFHDLAEQATERAEYWEQEAKRRQEVAEPQREVTADVPGYWKKMYGDESSPNWAAVQEAWKTQQQINAEVRAEAKREALEAVRNERYEEAARTEENLEVLDGKFDTLEEVVGRSLTEKEQSEILDIADKYTPKDRQGNYAGPIMDFESAWEIYQLKNKVDTTPQKQSRDNITQIINNKSSGTVSDPEVNKAFNPLDWNAWKKRI